MRRSEAADLHVHSMASHDGGASVLEMSRAAAAAGVEAIGFAEHKDFDRDDPVVNHFVYERYVEEVHQARAELGGSIKILMGVEIDYQAWFEDEIRSYLAAKAFDYVIGSVHYVARRMVMTSDFAGDRLADDCYSEYFDEVRRSAESGLFDVIGHPGYAMRRGVPRFGTYSGAGHARSVDGMLAAVVASGAALEVNTAGIRQGAGAMYPCAEHVARYRTLGGRRVVLGSDAHSPEHIAFAFDDALQMVAGCELCASPGRPAVRAGGRSRLPAQVP